MTLAITILISAVVSLTLVPMMSAYWLKHDPVPPEQRRGVGAAMQRFFDRVIGRYDRALQWVFAHQGITLLVALGTLVLTVVLYMLIPKGLFPTQDTGQLQARVQASPSVSFARMSTASGVAKPSSKTRSRVAVTSIVVDAANNKMLLRARSSMRADAAAGATIARLNRARRRCPRHPLLQPTRI